ncbi:MAG: hypothetical protein QF749_14205, partial [Verrucomicrobiota bacterium]|nr:hypothetical protein [Verrucomicrobiota bacterium]
NGGRFELGDGTPVSFWAVGVGSNRAGQNRDAVDYLARRLAKLGVNMVRYHSPMFDNSEEPGNIHRRKLDNLCYMGPLKNRCVGGPIGNGRKLITFRGQAL